MASANFTNSREHVSRAIRLRKTSPLAERILWNALRDLKEQTGLKFRWQHPLQPYIADFVCAQSRLIIEIDGPSHDTRQIYDAKRESDLRNRGWEILRFTNEDVQDNLNGVVQMIVDKASGKHSALPHPLPQAGGGHPPLSAT